MHLKGTSGEALYGYRTVSRFGEWSGTQEDGSPAIVIEIRGAVEDDEFFGQYAPTALRLKMGTRWMVYRDVRRLTDTQYSVSGIPEVQA